MKFFLQVFLILNSVKGIPVPGERIKRSHNSASSIQQSAFGTPIVSPGNHVNAFYQNRHQFIQLKPPPMVAQSLYLPIGQRFPTNYIRRPTNKVDHAWHKNMTFEERFEKCDITSGKFDTNIPSAKEGLLQDQVRVILILDETGSMSSNKKKHYFGL